MSHIYDGEILFMLFATLIMHFSGVALNNDKAIYIYIYCMWCVAASCYGIYKTLWGMQLLIKIMHYQRLLCEMLQSWGSLCISQTTDMCHPSRCLCYSERISLKPRPLLQITSLWGSSLGTRSKEAINVCIHELDVCTRPRMWLKVCDDQQSSMVAYMQTGLGLETVEHNNIFGSQGDNQWWPTACNSFQGILLRKPRYKLPPIERYLQLLSVPD